MKTPILIILISFFLSFFNFNAQFEFSKEINQTIEDPTFTLSRDIDYDGDIDIVGFTVEEVFWYENLGGEKFFQKQVIDTSINDVNSAVFEDIDNDGLEDIIVASFSNNTVVWIKNLGGGSFGVKQIITNTVNGPKKILCSDIDNDGFLDVSIVSSTDGNVVWCRNNGNGNFLNPITVIGSLVTPTALVLSDVNNDGNIDVVSSSSSEGGIITSLNLGGGNFATPYELVTDTLGRLDIKILDFDGDGLNDVISIYNSINFLNNPVGAVVWNKNLGTSYSNKIYIGTYGDTFKFMSVEDMDNDGDFDFILQEEYSGNRNIASVENLGGGNYGSKSSLYFYGTTTLHNYYFEVVDIDGDGLLDVIASTQANRPRIELYKNLGGMNYRKPTLLTGFYVGGEIFGVDIDQDSDLDILFRYGNIVGWYEQLGNNNFTSPNYFNYTGSFGASGIIHDLDVDNDGLNDLIVGSTVGISPNSIKWLKNMGSGVFSDSVYEIEIANFFGARRFESGDINDDGNADIVILSPNKILWKEKQYGGGFSAGYHLIDSIGSINNNSNIKIVDFNNDGLNDILFIHLGDFIAWYKNLGNGVFSSSNLITNTLPNDHSKISCQDIDNDSFVDVVSSANKTTSSSVPHDKTFVLYRNMGDETFSNSIELENVGSTNKKLTFNSADFDNDGDVDILTSLGDTLYWQENLGNGVFSNRIVVYIVENKHYSSSSYDRYPTIEVFDIDNDNDQDIILRITYYQSYYHPKTSAVILENKFISNNQIKGRVFFDANQDGENDLSEDGLPFIHLTKNPNSNSSYTANNGNYFFNSGFGSHLVSYNSDSLWNLTTDSSSYTCNISTTDTIIENLDFGFYPDTIITVLDPNLTIGFPRCNQNTNIWALITNKGTSKPSGVIKLRLHDSLIFVSSNISPDSIVGQDYYWHFDSLFYQATKQINLTVTLPSFMNIGVPLPSYLTVIEIDSTGSNAYTNSDTLITNIVCAYDPNDKSVLPKGEGVEGYISFNEELEYLIRFQNTGNDTAITIRIEDSLSSNLDYSTFQYIGASHNVEVHLRNGVLEFVFDSIMLPDSIADEPNSHGFVKYSITPIQNLLPNTPILNNAHIYFDYNPAIITNYTLNTIECYEEIVPNITNNSSILESNIMGNYTYNWYYNGSLIDSSNVMDISAENIGEYLVEVTDSHNCSFFSSPYNYVSILENEKVKVLVYPNPFNNSTTIKFDQDLKGNYDFIIHSTNGSEVLKLENIYGNVLTIDKKDLGIGVYFCTLFERSSKEQIKINKLLIY